MKRLNINENFICRIWEDSSFYKDLRTAEGLQIVIIDYGRKNSDAGPDYKDARIKIGDRIYSGSVELHRSENDWHHHGHKADCKYSDVILHVVFYREDIESGRIPAKAKKSRMIPTVYLSEFLTRSVHEIWKEIINNPSPSFRLPCFGLNKSVPDSIVNEWIAKLAVERLRNKCDRMEERFNELAEKSSGMDQWKQLLFEFICEALGYSKNKNQMLTLARRISVQEISKLNLDPVMMDSLCFGLSGFLKDMRFRDDYIISLKSCWNELRDTVKKEIMDKSEWNFFRLRPQNFPTIRIAAASGILNEIINRDFLERLMQIIEAGDLRSGIESLMTNLTFSDYWKNHYRFGKESPQSKNIIGSERINDIIVNVFLPFICIYSEKNGKQNLKNRVLFFYKKESQCRGRNEIVRVMENQLCFNVSSLSGEQGLIQLHNFFCIEGKCSQCEIGKAVFISNKVNEPLKIILY